MTDSNISDDYSDVSEEGDAEGHQHESDLYLAQKLFKRSSRIQWTGYGKKTPVLIFVAGQLSKKDEGVRQIGEKHRLAYKMMKTECKLLRNLLESHGFTEVSMTSNDFNLVWSGCHLKPYNLRGMLEFQKINHFPRSYEMTRKDRLYKNVQRMQQLKGLRHFDFMPLSFIMPNEYQDFTAVHSKDRGPWIVKPVASSRGRGIFLVNHSDQVPLDEPTIVSKYLANPLLIDGFKFDVRLYVAVTSFNPLIVYLYEEGLTRFATVKYEKTNRSIRNICMHLTNYSLNKRNHEYVRNDDAEVEDYGNKWSLGALLRYLRTTNHDTTALMLRVEDLIIKTMLSAELQISTACKMYMPHRGNCFELYGFDILIDEMMKPWLLEVNLSPSLACDSPLDLKIKSNLMSDLFSLIGFKVVNPQSGKSGRRSRDALCRPKSQQWSRAPEKGWPVKRPPSSTRPTSRPHGTGSGLTSEEIKIVRQAREEFSRCGRFLRIFPAVGSWELFGSYFQSSSKLNLMLYQQLFPGRVDQVGSKLSSSFHSALRMRSASGTQGLISQLPSNQQLESLMASATRRAEQYERKLFSSSGKSTSSPSPDLSSASVSQLPVGPSKPSSESSDGTPAMPAPEETFDHDVVTLIKDGHLLRERQARHVFSEYLMRVKCRLIEEVNDIDSQLELVIQFLKKAAENLKNPFSIATPNKQLNLFEQKRLLAKQLLHFIHLYKKESKSLPPEEQLDNQRYVPDEGFFSFAERAAESELEEILTTYTTIHKSASIFLGSRNGVQRQPGGIRRSSISSPSLRHRSLSGGGGGGDREPDSLQASGKGSNGSKSLSSLQPCEHAHSLPRNVRDLVSIYSGSVLQRPVWAVLPSTHLLTSSSCRPLTCKPSHIRKADNFSENEVNKTLERLSEKQKNRQLRSASLERDTLSHGLLREQSRTLLEKTKAQHRAMLSHIADRHPRPPTGPLPSSKATKIRRSARPLTDSANVPEPSLT